MMGYGCGEGGVLEGFVSLLNGGVLGEARNERIE